MTTAYTSLLGLALPVTGELSGTWGDTVNNSITSLLDTAVAGTTTLSTDLDVTLSTTTGAANQSRQAILLCSGARTAIRTITAPAQSKIYTVINATTGGYSVKVVGVGPTTGVTILAGESAQIAWNGSDFIKISNTAGAGVFTSITNSGLTSGRVVYSTTGGLETDSANLLYSGTDLTVYGITVGRGAGAVSTNTAVGASALAANTTGGFNTAFGYGAGATNITGTNNLFVGRFAGNASTGNNNTFVGDAAAYQNTSGGANTAVGEQTLQANTTASSNTAVGYQAGYNNTTGQFNVLLGCQAGYRSAGAGSIGDASVYIGYQAGYANQGNNNVGIGNGTGFTTTTGTFNTSVGAGAFYFNTTGAYNVSVGNNALASNTTSSYNTAVGFNALNANTTGGGAPNSAFGYNSLALNTTGGFNFGAGGNSLYANTTGNYNTGLGMQALYNNTTASNNTAVGYQALYSNTTGQINIALGYQAGYSTTNANYNTFLGYQAGKNFNTSGDTGNTFVGMNAGLSVTTGTGNTFVGAWGPGNTSGAGQNMTTGSKNTILGAYNGNQGGLDIRTASNYIVLSDGDGTPKGVFDNSGNLLINKTDAGNSTAGVRIGNYAGTVGTSSYVKTSSGQYTAAAFYYAGTNVGYIDYTNSATIYSTSSDIRLKKDVVDAPSASAKIDQIRIVSHGWKHDAETVEFGTIAQELHTIAPQAVIKGDDGETIEKTWAVDYSKLVPLLIKAHQELKAEFDAYKATHP